MRSSLSLRPSQPICILLQWGLVMCRVHACARVHVCMQILCSRVSFSTALGAVAPAALGRLAVGRSGEWVVKHS